MTPQSVYYAVKALDAALLLFVGAAEAKVELEKRRTVLLALADEGRDPTQAEWDDLEMTLSALRMKLHQD